MDIEELLAFTKNCGASDLHISSEVEPHIRLDGQLRPVDSPPLTHEEVHELVYDILTDEQQAYFEENLEIDFAVELEGIARFRVNAYHMSRGMAAAFRLIPSKIMTLEDLGMPHIVGEFAMRPNGLVVVTGPTGCGKSTTLAAMVGRINGTRECHVITIEDPIEFLHVCKRSLIHQREVHKHSHSFANALRAALREDPDVILVGEMRDLETTELAVTAAETGHLVLATLHTSDAPKSIDRIIDMFPAHQQSQIRTMISESLQGVIAQTLLPRIGGGRVAALEILVGIPSVRNLIREQKSFQLASVIQTGAQHGMQTLAQSIESLVAKGIVSKEYLISPDALDTSLRAAPVTDISAAQIDDEFEAWRQSAEKRR